MSSVPLIRWESLEKIRQLRSRGFVVLTYSMYAPGAKSPAALLDESFQGTPEGHCWMTFLSALKNRVFSSG